MLGKKTVYNRVWLVCKFASKSLKWNLVFKRRLPGRQGEVDERDFGGCFGRVVWIWQLCRHVKLEIFVIRNDRVAQFDHKTSLLSERLHGNTSNRRQHRLSFCAPPQVCINAKKIACLHYNNDDNKQKFQTHNSQKKLSQRST